jgi:hemerythrin superfamily protein
MPTPREDTTAKAKSAKKTDKAEDAIKLLTKDHREVEALFEKFEDAKDDDAEKADIVAQICEALSVHAEIEEEIFYPAAREALNEKGEDLLDEAEVEHASIKSLVAQLEEAEPGDDLYDAKVKVLTEYVKHHVKEEEGELFPKVKKTSLDLNELGAELFERKTELMADDEEGEEEEDNPE